MSLASVLLLTAFEKALRNCTEPQKQKILGPLNKYLDTWEGRFGVPEFVFYVDRAIESLKAETGSVP